MSTDSTVDPERAGDAAAPSKAAAPRGSRLRALGDRLRELDPNVDETAESVSPLFLAVFAVALAATAYSYLRFTLQPMQDLGHHLGLAAIVSDWGRPGSIYTALYEPFDPLCANSLLYTVAGSFGRYVGVVPAMQACMLLYLAGTPLAMLFALRVFGRSPWPAIIAVPLAYDMNFVAGFANFLFAAPFLVLSIALYQRFLDLPTRGRGLSAALFFALTFLAHAHVYLFLGVVTMGMTLASAAKVATTGEPIAGSRARRVARRFGRALARLGLAIAVALPSLLVFGRWASQVFLAPESPNTLGLGAGRDVAMLGARFLTYDESLRILFDNPSRTMIGVDEGRVLVALIGVTVLTWVLSRRTSFPRPAVLEWAFAVAFALYFLLPEDVAGQQIIATRQVGVALWFLPALLSPVQPRVSRLSHALVVLAMLGYSTLFAHTWNQQLEAFDRTEARGLLHLLRSAPPRLRLHYAKADPGSVYFRWRPFWHVEKYYMALRLGQTPDTPAIYAHSAVRFRPGIDYHRLDVHDVRVAFDDAVWTNFDLVLLRRFRTNPQVRAELERHGTLLGREGDWELWRSRMSQPSAPVAPR